MKHKNQKLICVKSGAAMISAMIIFLAVSLSIMVSASTLSTSEALRHDDFVNSEVSYYRAEAGVEDLIYRIKKGLPFDAAVENVLIGGVTTSVSLVSAANAWTIVGTATTSGVARTMNVQLTRGSGADFAYGVQVGDLGLGMGSNSNVKGSVYTNGSITGASNSKIEGSASAHLTITTPDPQVTGTKSVGVPELPMPAQDPTTWKAQAESGGVLVGNQTFTGDSYLGPKKIVGNLIVDGTMRVKGPIYVTGTLEVKNGKQMKADASVGSAGAVVVVDGTMTFKQNSTANPNSADPRGFLLFLGMAAAGDGAVVENSSDIKAVIATPSSRVHLGNSQVSVISGRGVTLDNSAEVEYEFGATHPTFSGGPSGGWKVSSWTEQ